MTNAVLRTFFLISLLSGCAAVRAPPKAPADTMPSPRQSNRSTPQSTTPSLEEAEQLVRDIEQEAWGAPAKDHITIEVILGILRRADRSELSLITSERRRFPLSIPRQEVFWHAALEIADVLVSTPGCNARERVVSFFLTLQMKDSLPSDQLVPLAALHLLLTRFEDEYQCVSIFHI